MKSTRVVGIAACICGVLTFISVALADVTSMVYEGVGGSSDSLQVFGSDVNGYPTLRFHYVSSHLDFTPTGAGTFFPATTDSVTSISVNGVTVWDQSTGTVPHHSYSFGLSMND